MRKVIYFVLAVIFFSCDSSLYQDVSDIPTSVFEVFWNDFDKHYGLFEIKEVDWDAAYNVYSQRVDDQMSDDQLWNVLSELIEELDDSHTNLYDAKGKKYTSGYALNELSIAEYSKELISDKYLEYRQIISSEDDLSYGKLKNNNIGYIQLGTMDGNNPEVIDQVLAELQETDGLIFDIRQNTGGDDRYSARIAQAFSDGEHFIYTVETRNGPEHNDFDDQKKYFTKQPYNSYTKPVVVLTDRRTISSGEIFLLHMKSFENVIQVGDTTAGDFSTVSNMRFLPNGWHYLFSIQKVLLPNGESLEGIGHLPKVLVKNSKEDIMARNDLVLEKAKEVLLSGQR